MQKRHKNLQNNNQKIFGETKRKIFAHAWSLFETWILMNIKFVW